MNVWESELFRKLYPLFENVAVLAMKIKTSKRAIKKAHIATEQIKKLPEHERDFLNYHKDEFWLKFNIRNPSDSNKIQCYLPFLDYSSILETDNWLVVQ